MGTQGQFAHDVLAKAGLPTHINNHVSLIGWMQGEGTKARYNPFATTRKMPGDSAFNTSNVRDYTTWEQGVEATVLTLFNGQPTYTPILRNLRAHLAAYYTLTSVRDSAWGTFHSAEPIDLALYVEGIRARWSLYAFKGIPT
jgi:hypothetical protein